MNESKPPSADWKLRLRYGKQTTPFKHFTALAEGVMKKETNDFQCPIGEAFMSMKTWATDSDESADMIRVIGEQIGFEITGNIRSMIPNLSSHQERIRLVMKSHSPHFKTKKEPDKAPEPTPSDDTLPASAGNAPDDSVAYF